MLEKIRKVNGTTPLIHALMEHCEEIISIKDLNYTYIGCNKAFLQHFGLNSQEDAVGKTIFELVPERNLHFLKQNLDIVLQTGKTHRYSFQIVTMSDLRIVQQTSMPIIHDGQIKFILSISRDITEDEKLKEEILSKNNQLNTLLEYLPMLVYMKDKNRNYILGSKHAKDFVDNGFDPYADNIQVNLDLSSAETKDEDNYVLNAKQILLKEKSAYDVTGKKHWYNILKVPIINSHKEVDGMVTIAQNVDKYKELENQKDMFIATLVHDLKNPLLAQISSMELLNKGYFGVLSDTQKEITDVILESANYMKEMLYTLINTYKYDNGNIRLNRQETNIEELLQTCMVEQNSLAQQKGVELSYRSKLSKGDACIYVDQTQIRRVITNLLNNGINYAYPNTKFKIKVSLKKDFLKVSFTNVGPAIDEQTQKYIFDKYISGSNRYQKIGFGLGMYLSKKVIEAHNGDIYLKVKGSANKFVILLPLKQTDEKARITW